MFRNKKETRSYSEIFQTVGVDKPSDILFVTNVFEEAVAARAAGNCLSGFTMLLLGLLSPTITLALAVKFWKAIELQFAAEKRNNVWDPILTT